MITIKSTGTLFDEMITTDFKIAYWPHDVGIANRRHDLGDAITVRLLRGYGNYDNSLLWQTVNELRSVLRECWDAQQTVMEYSNLEKVPEDELFIVTNAAIRAQRTNAARNKLIRKIDQILGEEEATQLKKTYE